MTIDETIKHCIEAAAKNKTLASEIGEQLIGTPFEKYTIECQERAAKYNQFAEWLTELKTAKRLLKLAMKDMKTIYESGKDEGCYGIEFKWRYADEAEKLLNGGVENEKI